ncbi:MAG: ChaN family lipoprotein [Flammeovirgaceae bacterium]|nr:ChaN family lipoprotein [Flammeovirgaceae bacterium]
MRTLLFILLAPMAWAQQKQAYSLFTKEGKQTEYEELIKACAKADVVLFGELHNNPIDHWLELQVTKDLYDKQPQLSLGFEMFEADDQIVLSEYLAGTIEEKHLLSEAKVWDNYKTDYKPLIEFAKKNKLKALATNIPRRYANLVYRNGVESLNTLPDEAKKWIASLPFAIDLTLPGYKEMITSMGSHGTTASAENLAKSQASKDATMARFILENKNKIFIHFHGAYHSQNFEGIYWYLNKADKNLKIVTIHSVEQEKIDTLLEENKNAGDFIIVIPTDMTKTY